MSIYPDVRPDAADLDSMNGYGGNTWNIDDVTDPF